MDAVRAAAAAIDWSILGERALCDPCLGRLVGKAGHGFSNAARGAAIRASVAVSEGACWLCGALMEEVGKFADLVVRELAAWDYRTFVVGTKVDAEVSEREERLWAELALAQAEPIKAELNREIGKAVSAATGKDADRAHPDVTAIVDTRFDAVHVDVSPLFLYGRYRKLSRDIPQTRWPCTRCQGKGCDHCGGKGKMYETSVEEVVAAAVMAQTGGTAHALHGMGREDVDARMLGNGRPFVLEVSEPRRRAVNVDAVAAIVNASGLVEVVGIRPSRRDEVVAVKEDRADKSYDVHVAFERPVDEPNLKGGIQALTGARLAQRTPTRVAHRRADRVRERTVRTIELVQFDGTEARLLVTAEAGTYVKEVLHGDGGRTRPNLADLCGVPCRVLALDVVRIHDGG